MKAFKAYDIRGVWLMDLDETLVYRIGYFYNRIFRVKSVLVGRDIRISSIAMFKALTEGLLDSGVDVYDAGLTTTPMNYWGNGTFGFDASIMITASHNAPEYNGLKFSGYDVQPIGYAEGLDRLEALVDSNELVVKRERGRLYQKDYAKEYLQFLEKFTVNFDALKVAVDCSNGMAGLFASQLFGDNTIYINLNPDGNFPAHHPNPLEAKNRTQIETLVKEEHCDVGVIFDGDADRVMFIDEKGQFVSPDMVIALLGLHFFSGNTHSGKVVQDIRTSKSVSEFLTRFGVEVETWRVGRAFGATKLKEVNGIYGGELAGHYYFRDFFFSDSGLMAALLVLQILNKAAADNISFSQLIAGISVYANTGEVNFQIEQKQEAMDALKAYFEKNEAPERFMDFDGYRLEFADWWFNIRPSNTEPYLRFLAEAKTESLLKEKTELIYKILNTFK